MINLVNGQLQSAADAVIWDLYSGSGLFTLPLATMTGERTRMLSVEGARVAVKNAQRNLRAMNLNDVDARAVTSRARWTMCRRIWPSRMS